MRSVRGVGIDGSGGPFSQNHFLHARSGIRSFNSYYYVTGNKFSNLDMGIYSQHWLWTVTDHFFSKNTFSGINLTGIRIDGGFSDRIEGNSFNDIGAVAFIPGGSIVLMTGTCYKVFGNSIKNSGFGIFSQNTLGCGVHDKPNPSRIWKNNILTTKTSIGLFGRNQTDLQ